jgi:hypothetical protein
VDSEKQYDETTVFLTSCTQKGGCNGEHHAQLVELSKHYDHRNNRLYKVLRKK